MASTYLTRTLSSAGSLTTFTISLWIKRSALSTYNTLFQAQANGGYFRLLLDSNKINILDDTSGVNKTTSALFRDTSAWYHLVFAFDSTQATASNRDRLYINGEEITSWSTNTPSTQNNSYRWQENNQVQNIGRHASAGDYFDGLMTHIHVCDGTQYSASDFGETDATTGIWKPKTAPSVTYGTNGFFLKFENSGAMGTDSSGNSNNFTVNGTMTQTIDTPSNVFATLNPLIASSIPTYSNGNLTIAGASTWESSPSTLAVSSGKYYAEFKDVSGTNNMVGVENAEIQSWIVQFPGWSSDGWGYARDGGKRNSGIDTSYGSSFTSGDIISIALDMDNKYVYFAKNGVWQNSGDPTSGATGTGGLSLSADLYYFVTASFNSSSSANFGNGYFGTTAVSSAENPDDGIGIFEYAVPTGYKALCTKSINAQEYD